ncbi:hypothetical protein GUITHDRAFT_140212 [Guillardia theta CCMP2712]|uniref:Uncharacterized protein n=1 Tax=Guillardia theta (strain CCMP2712) TaxID=905079 RepID=L1J5G1_GUITC|nr:hypothetical protein GUITHDRAFT_140212 [Guillardia theta CCMP2712]EKX43763.1 hypothetical protein GUITHDRAFT_140212 [Guillardia theta CCMP2712]|eukprot:XP_005830743.1 hypothetical protein GUITHDRAFT_140212 [Guillardia theta CCMP2712]
MVMRLLIAAIVGTLVKQLPLRDGTEQVTRTLRLKGGRMDNPRSLDSGYSTRPTKEEVEKARKQFLLDPEISSQNDPMAKMHKEDFLNFLDYAAQDHTDEMFLYEAANLGDIDQVEAILQSGQVSIDSKFLNRTALMVAAAAGHMNVLCLLLQNGAKTEIRDSKGRTALHFAVEKGYPLAVEVEILLRCGADPNVYDYTYKHLPNCKAMDLHSQFALLINVAVSGTLQPDCGISPLHLARRFMRRSTAEDHPLYDPRLRRGGDSYWRIECMLIEWGAHQWLPRNGWIQHSFRPYCEDDTFDDLISGREPSQQEMKVMDICETYGYKPTKRELMPLKEILKATGLIPWLSKLTFIRCRSHNM